LVLRLVREILGIRRATFSGVECAGEPEAENRFDCFVNMIAIVSFDTVSNWNYCVLGAANLGGAWSNLWMLAAQSTNGQASFVEGATSGKGYYRLKCRLSHRGIANSETAGNWVKLLIQLKRVSERDHSAKVGC